MKSQICSTGPCKTHSYLLMYNFSCVFPPTTSALIYYFCSLYTIIRENIQAQRVHTSSPGCSSHLHCLSQPASKIQLLLRQTFDQCVFLTLSRLRHCHKAASLRDPPGSFLLKACKCIIYHSQINTEKKSAHSSES